MTDDLISRKAAIKIAESYEDDVYRSIGKGVVEDLKNLPSVQPAIQCNQCKYYEGVHNFQGHAPCSYWKSGGVLWNWFCSQGEVYVKTQNE